MNHRTDKAEDLHRPVMAEEVISFLQPAGKELIVDATLGLGGHSEALLRSDPEIRMIGIDRDTEALRLSSERLGIFGERFTAIHSDFRELKKALAGTPDLKPDGILADLGVSSLQLDSASRGFSFRFEAPLDMRMDPSADIPTAADLLEDLSEEEIANIIYRFGDERRSRAIARRVVERRKSGNPVRTTSELAALVASAVRAPKGSRIHPATRTFQALRMAVNGEIESLEIFVEDAIDLLNPEGVLAVITFHSIEDRIVKQAMQKASGKCFCPPKIPECVCGRSDKVEILTRKPVTATEAEVDENPRARSAKLRACKKK